MARHRLTEKQDEHPGFSVDTHLFRELGELLVGRDSTALAELVKNSYDADATEVTVYAERLHEGDGFIVVTDDGVGMTEPQFRRGFLRIASREKEAGERRSRRYKRRYTGEKGIGRLAAHKLSRQIHLNTVPWRPLDGARQRLEVTIDWDEIEKYESLEEASAAVELRRLSVPPRTKSGTEVRLDHLRRRWTIEERDQFINEAQAFEPPFFLVQELPASVGIAKLLFARPRIRDDRTDDPGFRIHFAGEFEAAGDYWDAFLGSAGWVLEVRATARGVEYVVAPTQRTVADLGLSDGQVQRYRVDHPDRAAGPFFDGRMLLRERASETNVFRQWLRGSAGIRVFMEGFRVLPYGEWRNDWLLIDADYTARDRALRTLRGRDDLGGAVADEGINLLPNDAWVGAVFLTEAGSPGLQTLVNREGFIPNESFAHLVTLTRLGTDLTIRARAAARIAVREERARARGAGRAQRTGPPPTPHAVQMREAFRSSVERTTQLSREARSALAVGDTPAADAALDQLSGELQTLGIELNRFVREQSVLPVMA